MYTSHQHRDILERYCSILERSDHEETASIVREAGADPSAIQNEEAAQADIDFPEEFREEFTAAIAFSILQHHERNSNKQVNYDRTITEPFGYGTRLQIIAGASTQFERALECLSIYGDTGSGMSTKETDDQLLAQIETTGYDQESAMFLGLAYSIGSVLVSIHSPPDIGLLG